MNLSAALASPRRRVLLVDLDSQASSSLWLGVPRRHLRPSSASCLLEKYPIQEAVRVPGSALDDALQNLLGSIERVRTRMRAKARILGLVLTLLEAQHKQAREIAERIRAEFRDRVFHTEIGWMAALAEAAEASLRQSRPIDD